LFFHIYYKLSESAYDSNCVRVRTTKTKKYYNHPEGVCNMTKFMAKLTAVAMNQKGATAIEYGLIAAGIAVAIVAVVFTLGGKVQGAFSTVEAAM
jgi:pilus assembly protein Flp/PilA